MFAERAPCLMPRKFTGMKPDLSVSIAGIKMKNPVMAASGTFGCGREYSEVLDLESLGALVVKSLTLKETRGHPTPRVCETPSGLLNAIGLQNKGVDYFLETDLPFLRKFRLPVIASIAGETIEEYEKVAERLEGARGLSGIELNVSCPNIKKGGLQFGSDRRLLQQVVSRVRKQTRFPLMVKLTPNVTSIEEMAEVAVDSGADALSLINSVSGMSIDIRTRKPKLANITGGLTGPAIRPIAVHMIWQVAKRVKVPIVGMGGISSAEDAVEFFLAGASAVAVGTANFIDPRATASIVDGLVKFLEEQKLKSIKELVGGLKV